MADLPEIGVERVLSRAHILAASCSRDSNGILARRRGWPRPDKNATLCFGGILLEFDIQTTHRVHNA
jgi:hypothetical protein